MTVQRVLSKATRYRVVVLTSYRRVECQDPLATANGSVS